MDNARVFRMAFASVYPHYITKAEKKGRTKEEVHAIIHWLTGYDEQTLQEQIDKKVDFETFFARAPRINPNVSDAKSDFKSDDVKVGMTREELMAITGKPYSKITIPIEGGSSERLTFQMQDGSLIRIVIELEKVTEVKPLETKH